MARNKSEKEIVSDVALVKAVEASSEKIGDAFERLRLRSGQLRRQQDELVNTFFDSNKMVNSMMNSMMAATAALAGQMAYEKGLEIEVTDGEK